MTPEVLKTQIEECVAQFIANGVSFTAYDVTKTIRHNFPKENVEHGAVRAEVHNQMVDELDEDYTRTSRKFGSYSAMVYHHYDNDASDYDPNAIELPSQPNELGLNEPSAVQVDAPALNEPAPQFFSRDSRGRLLVPAAFVKHLPYQNVSIRIFDLGNNEGILLSSPAIDPPYGIQIASLRVDNHGYLYVSDRLLKKAGINVDGGFNIKTDGNCVVVKPA